MIKIGQLALEIFKFESVDDGRRTDDGPLVYYKLTLWAFGSGELKNNLETAASELNIVIYTYEMYKVSE